MASEITSVDFTTFTTDDILSASVKQIVNPATFDETSIHVRPNEGGLYDPALGANKDLGTLYVHLWTIPQSMLARLEALLC